MAAPRFYGDPFTGEGTYVDATGLEMTGSLSDFFGGRFRVSNGSFIDTLDIMNPLRIGQQGDFSMTELRGGRYALASETQAGALNRGFGTHTELDRQGDPVEVPNDFMRMVSGTVSVRIGDEIVGTFEVPVRPVTGIGRQWVAYQTDSGEWDFRTARGPFNTTADVQEALGLRYRLATGEEAAHRALFSMLLAENRGLLDSLLRAQGIDLTGSDLDRNYGFGELFPLLEFEQYRSHTASIITTPGR